MYTFVSQVQVDGIMELEMSEDVEATIQDSGWQLLNSPLVQVHDAT